jgi:hypothetical protein
VALPHDHVGSEIPGRAQDPHRGRIRHRHAQRVVPVREIGRGPDVLEAAEHVGMSGDDRGGAGGIDPAPVDHSVVAERDDLEGQP